MTKRAQSRRELFFCCAMTVCMMWTASSWAVPDDIVVYSDEINKPGQIGLEQHVNYVVTGLQTPGYPGQMPTHHLTQLTSEFTYGISNEFEAGMYLPLAVNADRNVYLNGLRLRLKYLVPRQRGDNFFYGISVEGGNASSRVSESTSVLEFRPIVGYRAAEWLLSFNPILSMGDQMAQQPQFNPALKLAHRVHENVQAGLEYYGEYGAMNNLSPVNQAVHTVYAVMDVETPAFDANFGVGHGFAYAPDAWAVKAIISLPLK